MKIIAVSGSLGASLVKATGCPIDGESGKISSGWAEIVIERPEAELGELKRWATGGAAP